MDSQRAARLRKLSPDTGIIGELLVTEGGERARTGMRYPLTLEGTIGSSRRADIRVRHHSVRGRHAIYQMTDEGLFVRGHASNRIYDGAGRAARELLLRDGEVLGVGNVELMLVLTDGGNPVAENRRHKPHRRPEPGRQRPEPEDDALFRVGPGGPRDEYDDYDDF